MHRSTSQDSVNDEIIEATSKANLCGDYLPAVGKELVENNDMVLVLNKADKEKYPKGYKDGLDKFAQQSKEGTTLVKELNTAVSEVQDVLFNKNEDLRKENALLDAKCAVLEEKNIELEEQNIELKVKVVKLEEKNKEMKDDLLFFSDVIAKLRVRLGENI